MAAMSYRDFIISLIAEIEAPIQRRVIRDRTDPMKLEDDIFKKQFRISKSILHQLMLELRLPPSDIPDYIRLVFLELLGQLIAPILPLLLQTRGTRIALPILIGRVFFSINVQLIVDSSMLILAARAGFPGSVHDSFIWRGSSIRPHLEQKFRRDGNLWLIGDSGYPLEPWLMTPYPKEETARQTRFNRKLASARSCVERCNGVLKARFRCLFNHRTLHYQPYIASQIILACCVLHNMCMLHNVEWEESDVDNSVQPDTTPPTFIAPNNVLQVAKRIRDRIASNLR
ncbi:putative nuclease HARBI1 [Uloborus diversus]|uniref:putative nuclease HARBI1 n=1 Tax=Uloborus diversus TaxID=327109 RepID=UPI00240A6489|nr:putative nuclease HARBI1 [Uloborus diversus]